jgi:hypothetical protein
LPTTAFKKKLHTLRPNGGVDDAEVRIETRYTKERTRQESGDPEGIERGVRQLLADKVSGHLVGLWLLVAEHLRLGTWDLLCGWTGRTTERLEPRLALQMVHEAALCARGIRSNRTLTHRGAFALVNGLPFVGSDAAVHHLLAAQTIRRTQQLQVALGKLRFVCGDFPGKLLIIDPHRVRSFSKRHMRIRKPRPSEKPVRTAQTFWVLDADTQQPVCFTTATSARTVAQATPELLDLAAEILTSRKHVPLVLADAEHCCAELLDHVRQRDDFELLVPMPNTKAIRRQMEAIPAESFTRHWAGYATTRRAYQMQEGAEAGCYQYVQRTGERPEDWRYKGFASTVDGDEVEALAVDFPKRWHIEEYFNAYQPLGWNRAGTMNLNIRFAQMTMSLIAQTVIRQLRLRLGKPVAAWDAHHFAKDVLHALDGDVRVTGDTIVVTYYNAPNADLLRSHYQGLPDKLVQQGVSPEIPWLYGFKLDFRFR